MPAEITNYGELFKKLEIFKLSSRRKFLGIRQGKNASLKKGHGIEFADYREYQPGDNLRHIDWNLYARSNKLYLKTFQEEQSLRIMIVIDASNSMRQEQAGKWRYTCDLAVSFAYIALSEREDVVINVPGVGAFGPFIGMKSIHRIKKILNELPAISKINPFEEKTSLLSSIKYPGVCLFLSDFLIEIEDVISCFDLLKTKNLDITAIQVLGDLDYQPLNLAASALAQDSETGEELKIYFGESELNKYQSLLKDHQQQLHDYFNSSQTRYAIADTRKDIFDLLSTTLTSLGLLR